MISLVPARFYNVNYSFGGGDNIDSDLTENTCDKPHRTIIKAIEKQIKRTKNIMAKEGCS